MLRGPLRNSEALLTSSQGTPPRDWARGVNLKDYSNILLGVKKIISSKVGFFPFLFFFFFFFFSGIEHSTFVAPAVAEVSADLN